MGGPDPTGSPDVTAGAEAAFASYLARVQRGDPADFDAFCRERPGLEDSLRRLHGAWLSGRPDPGPSGRVRSIREFVAGLGVGADPNVSLDPDSPADPGSGVQERFQHLASRTGRYKLRGEVARGGMGVILRVWDQDLRRTLAMKAAFGRVRQEGSQPVDVQQMSRFLEEAQITGQLDHPGIVPVHELGVDEEGRMFFTMRLVKGRTLDEVIRLARTDEDGWNRVRALDVMVRVCEAMAYAHSKGVIHRDIKPANVMVGKFGEVYVMDWGLAKVIGRPDLHDLRLHPNVTLFRSQIRTDRIEDLGRTPDSPLVTMEGTIIGTPTYMPPEQAEGRVDELDPRSDVYSVGALLYTLLTGRMPYVDPDGKTTPGRVLTLLLAGPPAPVGEIDRGVPPELVAICEKAMQRRPADRYASMIDMAEDLRAYLERRVVRAYKTGAVHEFRKWVLRNKAVASAVAALLVITLGSAFFLAWQQKEKARQVGSAQAATEQARARAEANAREAGANAEAARVQAERAERQSYLANLAAAHASLRMDETGEAKALLAACPERYRAWEWRHLLLSTDTSLGVLRGHEGKVTSLAFSPDGGRIASGSEDKSVRLWDADGQTLFVLPGTSDGITALAFGGAGGDRIAAASKDLLVRIWDAEAGRLVGTLPGHESVVTSIAFSPDGSLVATGSEDGARVWDAATFQPLATLEHETPVQGVAFSPDGAEVLTANEEGVHVWRGSELARTIAIDEGATCLACAGTTVAAGALDGAIRLYARGTGEAKGTLVGHADPVSALRFAPDGTRLLSASLDKTVRVWDAADGATVAVLRGHDEAVLGVDCDWKSGRVVSGSADGTLRLWDMEGSAEVRTLPGDEDFLSCVAFDPSGRTVAAASAGHGEIRVWDAETGAALRYIPEAGGGLSSIAFSADGAWIAAGGEEDATGRLIDARTGEHVRTFTGHESNVTSVAFRPDGREIATGSTDRTVRLWDVATGEAVRIVRGHGKEVTSVAFSRDGSTLLTASFDGTARLWDAESGEERRVLGGPGDQPLLCAAFDPAGRRVFAGSADGTIRVWDAASGEEQPPLSGHTAPVRSVAFDPPGTRLVSGGQDKTVRVWDPASGDPLLRLRAHDGWVTSVAFSPDGTRIVSGSYDTTARVWRSAR